MPANAMTPIREEEVEVTMSANVGTQTLKEEADVNANMAAKTTTPVSEEEVKTSSSASTIVPVREEEQQLDSGVVVIGFLFQVPTVKWHPKLEMLSKAGLSQGQYERKVLAQEYVNSFYLFFFASRLLFLASRQRFP